MKKKQADNIDIEKLKHLYYVEKKTLKEVASFFGCSVSPIKRFMDNNDLERRGRRGIQNIDIEKLKHLYYVEKKTLRETAEILGCSVSPIKRFMDKNGLKRRTKSEIQKMFKAPIKLEIDIDKAVKLYFGEHLTLAEVGKKMGVSGQIVGSILEGAGYKKRKPGETKHKKRPGKPRFTPKQAEKIARLYIDSDLSMSKISERMGCSFGTVKKALLSLNIKLKIRNSGRKTIEKNKQNRMLRLQEIEMKRGGEPVDKKLVTPELVVKMKENDNLTIDCIAYKCHMTRMEVYKILNENGYMQGV